jgi:hypothetical protein
MKNCTLFVLSFLLVSCSSNSEKKVEKSFVDFHEQSDQTQISAIEEISVFSNCPNHDNNLSTIAQKIEFIPLAADPPINSFQIRDIAIANEYIFLSTIYQIFQYDRQGKYMKNIGNRGPGPKEFIQISNLQIDEEKNLIYVLDGTSRRILLYRFEGNFEKSFSLKFGESRMDIIDSTRIIFRQLMSDRFQPNSLLIKFIDYKGKETKTYHSHNYPIEKSDMEHYGAEVSFLWRDNGNAYYLEYGADTIFKILKDTIVPVRKLTGNLKANLKAHFQRETGKKLTILSYLMQPDAAVFESGQFMIFKLSSDYETFYMVYNKSTKAFHRTFYSNTSPVSLRNDMKKMDYFIDNGVSGLHFNPYFQSQGKAISLISAIDICEKRQEILDFIQEHPSEEGKKLSEIVKNLTEDDNDLMMVVTFK